MTKPPSKPDRHDSHSFLVRMWRDGPEEPWRASVKTVADGMELHFVSPEKLFLFLHEQIAVVPAEVVEAGQVDPAS